MAIFKKGFDRRDVFKISAGVGLAAGIGRIASVREGAMYQNLLAGAKLGSLNEVAYAAGNAPKRTLVHIVLIDKTQTALFQHIADGTPPLGADTAGGLAQTRVDFRGLPLTKLFADGLAELPPNVSMSMNVAWAKSTGNHTLVDSYIDGDLGSINSAFEILSGGTGILGAVGFNMNSNANTSRDAFTGPGQRQLTTYENVADLATTLEASTAPLKDKSSLEMVKFMDSLVTPKFEMRDRLVDLAKKIGAAVPKIKESQAATFVNEFRPPGAMQNGMAPTQPDGVMQQVNAVIALHAAGVARNFMIAVPWNDTNAGNSLTNTGGEFNADPLSMTPKIAQAITALHKAIPDLVIVTTSDGGRSQDNGDQNPGLAFLTGPSTVVQNGIIGTPYANTANLNRASGQATFNDGSRGVTSPADWYRTSLVALGLTPKSGKFVKQALKV
jgi:hypothetical protein